MKCLYSYIFILSVFCAIFCCAVCPYPVFSASGTLTPEQHSQINDALEVESTSNSKNSQISVITLDWFKCVDNIFPKFQDVKIVDVKTKEMFVVQRTGGTNHADIEPIDQENKDKILKIFGGDYNPERRPVWTNINGMWVASSLSAKPHGYSLISDNGQNGHFCLHFLNSKTQATNRIDALHQKSVRYAQKYGKLIQKIVHFD